MTLLLLFLVGVALLAIIILPVGFTERIPYRWCNECDSELTERGWCNTCRKIRPM